MNKEIIIYTGSTCGACKQMKDLLDKKEIKYTEKEIDKHQEEWNKIVQLTGLGSFPTLNIGNNFYLPGRDFQNPQQFVEWLKTADLNAEDYPLDMKIFEAFKTLTYSMNTALTRIFQQLEQNKK